MRETHDVAPIIDDGLFQAVEGSDAPVNVPLVLARHVADLPESQGHSLSAANRLRETVEELREEGRAAVMWAPTTRWRGPEAGAVKYFFREEEIEVYAKASLDTSRATHSFLLDGNGAVLFQGTLNAFLHYLNPLMVEYVAQAPYLESGTRPAIINRALNDLVRWARAQMDKGSRCICLFAASCADRYGQPGTLEAVWHLNPPHIAWGWKSRERVLYGYLDVQAATWVSGVITLLRLTYPDKWRWRSDAEGWE